MIRPMSTTARISTKKVCLPTFGQVLSLTDNSRAGTCNKPVASAEWQAECRIQCNSLFPFEHIVLAKVYNEKMKWKRPLLITETTWNRWLLRRFRYYQWWCFSNLCWLVRRPYLNSPWPFSASFRWLSQPTPWRTCRSNVQIVKTKDPSTRRAVFPVFETLFSP